MLSATSLSSTGSAGIGHNSLALKNNDSEDNAPLLPSQGGEWQCPINTSSNLETIQKQSMNVDGKRLIDEECSDNDDEV